MVLLSNRFDGSHFEHRLTASFRWSHPSSDVLLCLHRYVPLQLLTQALITTAAEARNSICARKADSGFSCQILRLHFKKTRNNRRRLLPVALLGFEQFFPGASEPVKTRAPVIL